MSEEAMSVISISLAIIAAITALVCAYFGLTFLAVLNAVCATLQLQWFLMLRRK